MGSMKTASQPPLLWVASTAEPETQGAMRWLTPGVPARVTVTHGPPGGRVAVRIDDGGDQRVDQVEIVVDENGWGQAEWDVPAWPWVRFRADGTSEVVRQVIDDFSLTHRVVHAVTHVLKSVCRLVEFVANDPGGASGATRRQRFGLLRKILRARRETGFRFSLAEHLIVAQKILQLPPALEGDVVECGCWNGATTITMSLACELAGRRLFVCDSFEGLPAPRADELTPTRGNGQNVTNWVEGSFAAEGGLEGVRATVTKYGAVDVCTFVPGYFCDSLPGLATDSIVLVYEDADLVSSIEDCLRHLWPKLRPGCHFFSDEPWYHDVVALFYDAAWWQRELGERPPGFTGSECGLAAAPSLGFATKPVARGNG
jgi:O-methyltransferase